MQIIGRAFRFPAAPPATGGPKGMLSGTGRLWSGHPRPAPRSDLAPGVLRRAALYTFGGGQRSQREQATILCDLATVQGWSVAGVFQDRAEHHGGSDRERSQRARMLRHVAHREVDVVAAVGVAYLCRSFEDLLRLLAAARLHGIRVVTLEDDLDTDAEGGQHVLAAVDHLLDLNETLRAASARSGAETARTAGQRLGRPPMDRAQRDRVAALLADGVGVNEIARRLGLPKSTVSRIKAEGGA